MEQRREESDLGDGGEEVDDGVGCSVATGTALGEEDIVIYNCSVPLLVSLVLVGIRRLAVAGPGGVEESTSGPEAEGKTGFQSGCQTSD